MKRIVICSLILLFISCSETKNMSHTETAQIVAESFFSKDESVLKKHTTANSCKIEPLIPIKVIQ